MFKQPKVFQFDNRPVFKRYVTKLTGKHNTGAQRATAKYKYTYIAFVNSFWIKILDSTFHPDGKYRNQKIQATAFIWSAYTYRLDRIVKGPGNSVL